jgi:hypothetical protein
MIFAQDSALLAFEDALRFPSTRRNPTSFESIGTNFHLIIEEYLCFASLALRFLCFFPSGLLIRTQFRYKQVFVFFRDYILLPLFRNYTLLHSLKDITLIFRILRLSVVLDSHCFSFEALILEGNVGVCFRILFDFLSGFSPTCKSRVFIGFVLGS